MGSVAIHLMYVTNPHFLLVGCMGKGEANPTHFWTAILGFVSFLHAKVLSVWSLIFLWIWLEVYVLFWVSNLYLPFGMTRICSNLFRARVDKLTNIMSCTLISNSKALNTYHREAFWRCLELILQCYDQEGWSHPPSRVLKGL